MPTKLFRSGKVRVIAVVAAALVLGLATAVQAASRPNFGYSVGVPSSNGTAVP